MSHCKNYIFLSILLSFSIFAFSVNNSYKLKITYIGNCGLMYQSLNSKIIVDPLGTEYGNYFFLPSDSALRQIVAGLSPYNNLNILLITHKHGDHFNFNLCEKMMLNNPGLYLVCPTQVLNILKDSCAHFKTIESRIRSRILTIGDTCQFKLAGVTVTAIRMQHGTNRDLQTITPDQYSEYEKTENWGYHIQANDKTIFHQGDGCLKINEKALRHLPTPIDICHLSYFDWDSISYKLVKDSLKANKIIFMHGTKPAKELHNENFSKLLEKLILFKKESDSIIIP